jgi:hypothetical protein
MMLMMLELHQMQHGSQNNHVTNHAKCAKSSKAKHSKVGKKSKANQIEPERSQMRTQMLPAQALQSP